MDNEGRIGIGTLSPSGELTIWGGSGEKLLFGDDTIPELGYISAHRSGTTGGDLYLGVNTGSGIQDLLSLNHNGNIGIGTTSPDRRLVLSDNGANTGCVLKLHRTGTSQGVGVGCLFFGNDNYEDLVTLGTYTYDGGTSSEFNIYLRNSGVNSNVLMIKPNGNVGIGTTSPTDKLHIVNNNSSSHALGITDTVGQSVITGEHIRFRPNDQEAWLGTDLSGNSLSIDSGMDIKFNTCSGSWGERMRIASNGNVGIGTMNPNEKLEVDGTVKATAFVGDGSGLTNIPGTSQGDDVTYVKAYCSDADLTNVPYDTPTLVPLIKEVDTKDEFDSSTHTWTAKETGIYLIIAKVTWVPWGDNAWRTGIGYWTYVYKNGIAVDHLQEIVHG